MDVILTERMDQLGEAGDIVSVSRGYARNFLIPRGMAYVADDGHRRIMDEEARLAGLRSKKLKLVAQCRKKGDMWQDYLIQEYTAYRGYEALTDNSFRARLVLALGFQRRPNLLLVSIDSFTLTLLASSSRSLACSRWVMSSWTETRTAALPTCGSL